MHTRQPLRWLACMAALTALVGQLAACNPAGSPTEESTAMKPDAAFLDTETAWRAERRERLVAPDGWTSLIGLHWITLKAHYIGSDAKSGIRLAKGPPTLGLLQVDNGRYFLTPEKGVVLTIDDKPLAGRTELFDDASEHPTTVAFDDGKGLMTLLARGDRHALRVKHADADSRTGFAGLEYWPADPSWNIEGRFLPNAKGKTIPVVDIIGMTNPMDNPGVVEFQRDGKPYRIEALDEGDGRLFLVFADRTNGHGSYGAGRFLYAEPPDASGKVTIDFNQAYNPPCAFTPFATCPLPPPENRLDLAITAGEKQYASGHVE